MIKGCTKRVIVVKDIDSNFFDEAFFIVKPLAAKRGVKEPDFINEAHRIVKSDLPKDVRIGHCNEMNGASSKKTAMRNKLREALMFILGVCLSALLCAFI